LGAVEEVDVPQLETEARRRLTEWRDLLQLDVVPKSRQMLKKLLAEPLRARPIEDGGTRGWELTGRAVISAVFPAPRTIVTCSHGSKRCLAWN
jgi:hypothetical protein